MPDGGDDASGSPGASIQTGGRAVWGCPVLTLAPFPGLFAGSQSPPTPVQTREKGPVTPRAAGGGGGGPQHCTSREHWSCASPGTVTIDSSLKSGQTCPFRILTLRLPLEKPINTTVGFEPLIEIKNKQERRRNSRMDTEYESEPSRHPRAPRGVGAVSRLDRGAPTPAVSAKGVSRFPVFGYVVSKRYRFASS